MIAILFALTLLPLGGAHLAVLAGARMDPHLLTGWLWKAALGRPSIHGFPARVWSALALALAIFPVVTVLRRRQMGFVAMLCGLILASSPLAFGVLLDPLGGEDFVSLALVAVMALDIAGLWKVPSTVRCALAAGLVLQDAWLAPAALLYPLLAGGSYRRILAQIASVAGGVALRALVAPSTLPSRHIAIDSIAGPETVIAMGCVLFAVAPLVLFGMRRRATAVVALSGGPFLRVITFGAAAASMGMFSAAGDPSPYWLCGETAFAIGLVGSALDQRRRAILTVALLGILAAQAGLFVQYRDDLPAVALTQASGVLRSVLAANAVSSTPICMVVDRSGEQHVLASGAFFALDPAVTPLRVVSDAKDCLDAAKGTDLVIIQNMLATDWGPGGIELARSAQIASEAPYVLPVKNGIVSPRTHANTPYGLGAFGDVVDTPIGAVGDFTVVSGFSYRFACPPHGNRLSFAVAGIAHTAFAYEIFVDNGSRLRRIVAGSSPASRSVASNAPTGTPYQATQAWRLQVGVLPETRLCRSIIFSVLSQPGVPDTWVTFAGASVLSDARSRVRERERGY